MANKLHAWVLEVEESGFGQCGCDLPIWDLVGLLGPTVGPPAER